MLPNKNIDRHQADDAPESDAQDGQYLSADKPGRVLNASRMPLVSALSEAGYESSNFMVSRDQETPGPMSRIEKASPGSDANSSRLAEIEAPRNDVLIGVCMPPTDRVTPLLKEGTLRSLAPRLNTLVEQIWRGISHVADAENCYVLQYPLPVWMSRSIDPFLSRPRVDGVVMLAGPNDPRAEQIVAAGIPVALVGRFGEIPKGCGAVFALESDTVNLAMSHLWRLGHRRIAHIAGPVEDVDAASSITGRQEFASQIAKERLDRYSSWMSMRRQYDASLIVRAGSWLAGPGFARVIVRQWKRLPNPPTAVFCASDSLAMDLLDAAKAEDISVPDQLSIIGVDNIRPGGHTSPALTTIELPAEDIGRAAMSLLLGLVDRVRFGSMGFEDDHTPIGFPVTKLVDRASTGRAPG